MRTPGTILACKLIAALTLTAASGCGREVSPLLVPAPLIGRWTTDNPDYAGRYLEITSTSVVLGVGEEVPQRYILHGISSTPQPIRGTLYRLTFIDREFEDYQVTFHIQREEGATILRLANQFQIAWRKETD